MRFFVQSFTQRLAYRRAYHLTTLSKPTLPFKIIKIDLHNNICCKFCLEYYCVNMQSTGKNQPLTNKSFWNLISPFLTNKNVRNDDVITLKEKGRLTNDELEVAETLNSHYINIVVTTCGQPPQALGNPKDQANDIALVDAIISNYKHHPSINQIRKKCSNPNSFPDAKKEEINILIKRLNPKKAAGPDGKPLKIIRLSAGVIDKHLTNVINTDLECLCFSENAKIDSVKPIYKKESRYDKNNYRPVTILNGFYKRFINNKLLTMSMM